MKNYTNISIFILLLAAILTSKVYMQNRSLFLDECNLARNIVEKPYGELFTNLEYHQHAPPFFSITTKFFINLFGVNEYAFRLFPFLAGLLSLFLFYKIAKHYLNRPSIWFALILFGFSFNLLQYNTMFKQYSIDVLMACLFLFFTTSIKIKNWKDALLLGMAGAIGIWFSMPLVFILAGVGLFYLVKNYQKSSIHLSPQNKMTFCMIAIWIVSFIGLFFVNLKPSINSSHLQDFHNDFFLKWPTSIANLQQNGKIFIRIFKGIVGKTAVPTIFAIFSFLVGVYVLIKRFPLKTILLLVPILACFLASLLSMYSFIIRLTLFLFPIIILIISLGLQKLYKGTLLLPKFQRNVSLFILAIASILSLVGGSGLVHFFTPLEKNNPRAVLQQLSATTYQNLPVYVSQFGTPAQELYTQLHQNPIAFPFKPIQHGAWNDDLIKLSKAWKAKNYKKIWIFDSHTYGKELANLEYQINQIGVIKEKYADKSAFAVLVELY